MKTSTLTKSLLSIIFIFMCSMTISAVSPKSYMYDTKEENGKIVSKTIFTQENGLLNKQVMYEFSYYEDGKVSEKKACRWNKTSEKWEPFFKITYTYDEKSGDIHTLYGMWDNKTKDYNLNVQEMTSTSSSYEEIFS